MPPQIIFTPEIESQIITAIRRSGNEKAGFEGIVSYSTYLLRKKKNRSFSERVSEALTQYRLEKAIESRQSTSYLKTLARQYFQEILLGKMYQTKIMIASDGTETIVREQIMANQMVLMRMIEDDFTNIDDKDFELSIQVANPDREPAADNLPVDNSVDYLPGTTLELTGSEIVEIS
jgi:hypothetical protein